MHRHLETVPSPASLALAAFLPRRRPAKDSGGKEATAPALSLTLEKLRVDPRELVTWRELCGFTSDDTVPVPYLFVLAFHAQAALLLHRSFPLRPLGMVHVACRLESHRQVEAGQDLKLEIKLQGWRRVRQGREVEVEIRYLRDGEEVAKGLQTSLARGGGTGEPRSQASRPGPPTGDCETWRLGADTGRRYAKVSGDHNPIHLWPWSARLFGHRRPIAHGMYLVARAVAALDATGKANNRLLDVRFKTPTELPGEVRAYLDRQGQAFELWKGDGSRPHVVGTYRAL